MEWLEKLQKSAETSDDAALKGVAEVASHTTKATAELTDQIKSVGDSAAAGIKAVDEKVESGFEQFSKQLDEVNKSAARFTVSDSKEAMLREALGDDRRAKCYSAEVFKADELAAGRKCAEPVEFYAVSDEWFTLATKAQIRGESGRYEKSRAETYERMAVLEKAFEDVYGKAAFSGTDAEGGYGVPDPVANEIFHIVRDAGVVVGDARVLPMMTDRITIPNESNNFTVYWGADGANLTGGENTFGQNIIEAEKLFARATASIEILEDNAVGLLPYIRTVMAEDLARELDQELLEGDGTNLTGLNTEASVNSVATTTTDGDALSYSDLVNAFLTAGESSTRVGGCWYMHPLIYGEAIKLADTAGLPIFGAQSGNPFATLFGRPVKTTTVISTDTTRGSTGSTSNIYFGPPNKIVLGRRNDFRWDVTDQANWGSYQMDMRMVGRFGSTIANPAAFTKIVGITQT